MKGKQILKREKRRMAEFQRGCKSVETSPITPYLFLFSLISSDIILHSL